mgnify:FL=1
MMNNGRKKVELLAPAGSLEKLRWAILYGADAVYIGGLNYSLRANAKNFSLDEIKEGVSFAHENNCKVYVTINIVFHNEDTKDLLSYLKQLEKIEVDAIIISDPLVIDLVKKNNIKLALHLSTQASVLNKDALKYYEKLGVERIVLARECSKADIEDIIKNTNMEIECFLHGAMCTNISGRCVLSNYFTNRDANRGGCCQVCRFNFNLYDKDKNKLSVEDNFSIAPKDLSLVEYLSDMIDIGVKSFKLEGRMRSIYYIATVVSTYRRLIDMYLSGKIDDKYVKKAIKILYRCCNRSVAPQFYEKEAGKNEQYYIGRQEDSNQDFLGVVIWYDKYLKQAVIEQRNFFKVGDKVTIFGHNIEDYSFNINEILDENGVLIDAARHPREFVRINCERPVPMNSIMRVNFLDWQN